MNRPFMKIRFFTGGRPMVAPTGLRESYHLRVTLSGEKYPVDVFRSRTRPQGGRRRRRRGLLRIFGVTLSGGEPASRSRSFATQEQNRGAKRRRGLLTIFHILCAEKKRMFGVSMRFEFLPVGVERNRIKERIRKIHGYIHR